MVDATALVPGVGYVSAGDTPEVSAAFAAKADELARDGIVAPGGLRDGWIDSTYCCRIMAEVAGLDQPQGFLAPHDVLRLFADADWPSLYGLRKGSTPSEYAYVRSAEAFVGVCLEHGLCIEFT